MPDDDCYQPKFPAEIEARIHRIAEETGASYDEVVNSLVRSMFELVDDPAKKEVPAFVRKIRSALRKKSKNGSKKS
jgi:hypothetical protein